MLTSPTIIHEAIAIKYTKIFLARQSLKEAWLTRYAAPQIPLFLWAEINASHELYDAVRPSGMADPPKWTNSREGSSSASRRSRSLDFECKSILFVLVTHFYPASLWALPSSLFLVSSVLYA